MSTPGTENTQRFTNKIEILKRFPFLKTFGSYPDAISFSVERLNPDILSSEPDFQSGPYSPKGPMREALVLDIDGKVLHTLHSTLCSTGGNQQNYGERILGERGETVEAGLRRLQEAGGLENAQFLLIRCGEGRREYSGTRPQLSIDTRTVRELSLYVGPTGGGIGEWLRSYCQEQSSRLDALVMPARAVGQKEG